MATLGFIGLGSMGNPMSRRLIEAGHSLTVCDLNAAATAALTASGASIAESPAAVARQADIIFTSLPTPASVCETASEVAAAGPRPAARTFVDLSTIGPRASREAAAILAKAGIDLVNAPVSGGRRSADQGTLAIMASAQPSALDRVKPFLDVLGRVFQVGDEPGLAQTMKLVNNMMSVAALAITSEGMVLGVKAGLDPARMIEVLNASSGRNSATEDKFPRAVLPRTFDFGFAIGLSMKDIGLCLGEAEQTGVPMPVGSAVHQVLAIAQALYGREADFTSICKVIEAWGGAEVRSPSRG